MIFLDPPYGQGWLEKMLPWCASLLAPDGYLYVETEMQLSIDDPTAPDPVSAASQAQALPLPAGWRSCVPIERDWCFTICCNTGAVREQCGP